MTAGLKTIVYPVEDLARAKALFGALLGTEPARTPRTTSDSRTPGRTSASTQRSRQGDDRTGPVLARRRHPGDVRLLEAGAETLQVQDVGGGRLIASVKDTDGNLVGLLQDGSGA